eukprot:Lithocolla_globosa_v1_NODE_744_length_3349_cov_25.243169.p4 type:complete len:112 gc:universal NODE_744_length_3349_cov_25.243169:3287-2952(-)
MAKSGSRGSRWIPCTAKTIFIVSESVLVSLVKLFTCKSEQILHPSNFLNNFCFSIFSYLPTKTGRKQVKSDAKRSTAISYNFNVGSTLPAKTFLQIDCKPISDITSTKCAL